MPQLYEGGGGGSEEDDAANPGLTDDDDLPQEEEEDDGGKKSLIRKKLKDKAKLPTLRDKVKKLKNNVPLGKNKNNAASEDDATTDDDALFSQRDGHEEEDDSSSSSCCCCCSSGQEYDSDDEKPQAVGGMVVSKQQQETSTPIINAFQDYTDSNVHHGNYSSEWQQKQQPHEVDESLKNLSLHPKKDQSCSNQEETHGNNLQEVEPESMGGATNNNCTAGGFTGLKSTVLGSAAAATASTVGSMFGYYSGGDHAGEKPSSGGGDQGGNTYNNQQATDHPAATGLKNDSVVGTKLGDTNNATTTTGDDDETYIQKAHNTVVSSLYLDEPSDPLNAHLFLDKTKEYMTSTTDAAKSYTATATDIAYNTRDKVGSATTAPGQEKGVAHQVTESFSNLPTTLKESMFSPSSPTSNFASSAISSPQDVKTGAPGLVSHVTGAVSVLFSSKKLGGATTVDDSSLAALHDNPTIQQEATGRSLNGKEEKNSPVTCIPAFHPVNTQVPLNVFFLLTLLNLVNKCLNAAAMRLKLREWIVVKCI